MDPREDLITNLDDHLHSLLRRPRMYTRSPETLAMMVCEALTIRRWAVGAAPVRFLDVMGRLGWRWDCTVIFPEKLTDETVAQLREIALEFGYEPGDRAARDDAWRAHWGECAGCRGGAGSRCDAGQVIWDDRPRAWE